MTTYKNMTNCLSKLLVDLYYKCVGLKNRSKKMRINDEEINLTQLTTNFYCLERKEDFWTKQETSLLKKILNYKIFNPIPKSFVDSAFFGVYDYEKQVYYGGPRMVLLNYDIYNGEKHALRGIACVSDDPENDNYLILDLIGNVSVKNETISSLKKNHKVLTKSGKDIIFYLKQYALNKKYKYFKLFSMENVIGFYWKYGWRFQKNITDRHSSIWHERVGKLNKIIANTDDGDDERDIILKKYFDRYLPGYYNDIELSKNNRWDKEHTEYDLINTLERQRWELRFHGYPMFWKCH